MAWRWHCWVWCLESFGKRGQRQVWGCLSGRSLCVCSKPVAFVGLAFIGALWLGVLWALKVHPWLIAALLLAAPLLVGWWWQQQTLQRPTSVRSVWFVAVSLLAGGLLVVWLLHLS